MCINDIRRFWSWVDVSGYNDCWLWKGTLCEGYGQFWLWSKTIQAHRFAYEITKGPLKNNCCHTCDNPPCCNPNHLWDGTVLENNQDSARKGRTAKGSRHGSHTHPERRAYGERNGSRLHLASRPRGSKNTSAKLTEEQVLQIRQEYTPGKISQKYLAEKYRIGQPRISSIVNRQSWQHI